jgi:hypothetical protein
MNPSIGNALAMSCEDLGPHGEVSVILIRGLLFRQSTGVPQTMPRTAAE